MLKILMKTLFILQWQHGLIITIKEPLECGFVHALFKTDLQFKIVSNIMLFIYYTLRNFILISGFIL